jgi:hypothetical protein
MKVNRHQFPLIAAFLMIGLLLSCTRQKEADSKSQAASQSIRPEGAIARDTTNIFNAKIDDFIANGLSLPGSRKTEIIANLGNPDSISARALQNLHNPEVTDSVFILIYKNLKVGIYHAGFDGREFIIGALVAENRYLKHTDLGIGAAAATVESILGKPHEADDSTYVYSCGDCPIEDKVRFHLSHNLITKVEFSYGVD